MHHCVAIYGRLLLIVGAMGYLASGTERWESVGPALLGVIALAVTRSPLRTPSDAVAAVAGCLIALLALSCSADAVAELPAMFAGDGAADGLMTLSRALTSLVSLSVLLALAAQWLQGQQQTGT